MAAFAVHLVSILFQWHYVSALTKPLLLLLLTVFYVSQSGYNRTAPQWKVIAALLFSLLGDVLLMFAGVDGLFFIAGLAAFLTAHIFYILYFIGEFRNGRYAFQPLVSVVVAAYAIGVYYFLYPSLGGMKWPVLFYTITIAVMLLMAIHACKEPCLLYTSPSPRD